MKKFSTQATSASSRITCAEINNRDIVDFLSSIGHQPARIKAPSYWYLSPLRAEKTASFKVNRRLNRWYDFGIGAGGSLIDFCLQYYHCGIPEVIEKFSWNCTALTNVPRHEPAKQAPRDSGIGSLQTRPLQTAALLRYLRERRIDEVVARQYCCEASYQVGGKSYYGIAFPNHKGGYELRNKYFKGGSSPKGPTWIDRQAARISVFEGFFDFLSFVTITRDLDISPSNFLILNSVSCLQQARPLIERHSFGWLFLDNDLAGDKATAHEMFQRPGILDQRRLYKGYKDLNEWLCEIGHPRGVSALFAT